MVPHGDTKGRSSSGQDSGLSIRQPEFDSPSPYFMKIITTAIVALACATAFAIPAQASHGSPSCAKWASVDKYHPQAPASYSSYNCSVSDNKYAQVNGRGKYSGTLHHVKIEAIHFNCWLFWCDTRYHVYAHWHG